MKKLFENIPNTWKVVKIPEVLFFQEGPGVRKHQFTKEGIKLLNVGNINKNEINLDTTDKYISEDEANGKYSHFLVEPGDLLIACSGIVVSNFHNKIAFAKEENLPLCLNTSTMRFKVLKEKKIDINYFKYYLQTVFFKKQLQRLITGSAQLNFGPSHIKKIKLPLPTVETQKRIAEILDNAAALCDKTKQLLEEYDQISQSIFLDMFGDPIINPKGWELNKIEKVCTKILGGGTPKKSNKEYFGGDIPWVTPKDMKKLYINNSKIKITRNAVKESSAKFIPKDSILMVIRSGILKKKLPIALSTSEVTVNQDMKAFIPDINVVNPKYLMFFFIKAQKFLLGKVRAVTADNIEFNQIKQMDIPTPPINLQTQFAEKITLIEQQKYLAKQELKESEDLFQALLQKAFKGELVKEKEFEMKLN